MKVNFQVSGRRTIARLSGELDEWTAPALKTALDESATSAGCAVLVLDLSELTFLDSTGVGIILGRYKRLKQLGKSLEITGASASVKKVLVTCGIDGIVKIS